jgi:integrase
MRRFLMSWEGKPYYRWVKMFKGCRYRVTCETLGLGKDRWTKEDSWQAANQWWQDRLAEMGQKPIGVQQVESVIDSAGGLEKWVETAVKGQAASQGLQLLTDMIGKDEAQSDQTIEIMQSVLSQAVKGPAISKNRTVEHQTEQYLALLRPRLKVKSYKEIQLFLPSLVNVIGNDIDAINEESVKVFWNHLRATGLGPSSRKKLMGFFRRFVRYLWEHEGITLPKNLDSELFKVKVTTKAVKTWPLATVRQVLGELKPNLKLYALLGLNCGFTNMDIANINKEAVDLQKGRLVHKRIKTHEQSNVPTVEYKLWPETLALLGRFQSNHPGLFLVSMKGTPLVSTVYDSEGEAHLKDMVVQQWRRYAADLPIKLKNFRSIGATLLEEHPVYGRYASHFLGHSPKTIAGKHYVAPSQKNFDEALDWLRGQIVS